MDLALILGIISNENFWIGITALATLFFPIAIPYIRITRKITKQLINLHDETPEDNEIIRQRAINNNYLGAAKLIAKKIAEDNIVKR